MPNHRILKMRKALVIVIITFFALLSLSVGVIGLTVALVYPELPSLEALTNYRPKLPLRVYSEDGFLMAEYGEERRRFVSISAVPKNLKAAVLAIEDRRFYSHHGIDLRGVLRAAFNNVFRKGREGASTITMQVARNFFLSPERSLRRKINEALLAIKIELTLSKDQIFELYLNQIFLGQRSYGFSAAAHTYFGKTIEELSLAESALLAGLPKAPSGYNPFLYPKRAIYRQQEVLKDMYRYGMIEQQAYEMALLEKLKFKKGKQTEELQADYVAEMVRQVLFDKYKESIYGSGIKVYTTILKKDQEAANLAVIQGIINYDDRHGYRGPEDHIKLEHTTFTEQELNGALDRMEYAGPFICAVVTGINARNVVVYGGNGEIIELTNDDLRLVLTNNKKKEKQLSIRVGDLVRIIYLDGRWRITQLPQVEAAMVAIDPKTGALRALVGGSNFAISQYNHATQARRQPGSSFKPFVYSAAMDKGFTPASVFDDNPITFSAEQTGSKDDWSPQNFDKKYEGPMRLRTALTKSKNMVSIRLIDQLGIDYVREFVARFGFDPQYHPPYLTMALGAGSVTVWEMARAYAIFANQGYKIAPYFIKKITDDSGKIIAETTPLEAGKTAPQVIEARNTFLMTSIMQDVTRFGTAASARKLGRNDIAGKTGTTNNSMDVWFAGYNPDRVAVVWMGFDAPRSLGKTETGGNTALPIWTYYMGTVLSNVADNNYPVPEGVISIGINPKTGLRARENETHLYEYFYEDNPPADPAPAEEITTPSELTVPLSTSPPSSEEEDLMF